MKQETSCLDVLGPRRAGLEPPFVDREPELLQSWGRKIGVARHPRGRRGSAEQDTRIVEARERMYQFEPVANGLVRRAAEPCSQQHVRQFRRKRETVEDNRHVDQSIIAISRFPVDQPEAFAIEQDVARDEIVVAGDKTCQTRVISLVEPLKAPNMRIKQAGRKKTGSAHMREQARDDVRIVDEDWEDRRGLNARKQLSHRLCQRARPARIGFQRLLVDEVDHRDAGDLIDKMDIRCNPGLRRDAHRGILVRIAQRTWLSLHA
jgi:hypothetical protein